MPNHRCASRFLALLVLGVLAAPCVRAAPPAEPGAPAASTPAKAGETAAPAAKGPARFSVKSGTCREFLALSSSLRGLTVAWTAGRYYQGRDRNAWVFDEASANRVIASVEQECGKTADASFRYKVVDVLKKQR